MSTAPRYRRAFVVGAHMPNGGTYMAYHLGRILERDFGIPAVAVQMGAETADNRILDYDLRMPVVTCAAMESEITDRDILIVNPSFSSHQFGWRLPGLKICYVQGFTTFALLDRFDHYVAVSRFVANFLRTVYAIETRVIPPFIHLERCHPAHDWSQRPANSMLISRKGLAEVWDVSWQRLRDVIGEKAPQILLQEPLAAAGLPQAELFDALGGTRYFVTLSAAEGFGLVPLEAMAMGCTVIGYDGFGGRDYMRAGENCLVAPYPGIDRVVADVIAAVSDDRRSADIARRGHETAQRYSYAAFRAAWIDEFSRALGVAPR